MTHASAANTVDELTNLISDFEVAQTTIRSRFRNIRDGKLAPRRIATKDLIAIRTSARKAVRTFLDNLSYEQQQVMAIAHGTRDWRQHYNQIIDPYNDPAFADARGGNHRCHRHDINVKSTHQNP